ncbi:VOC family protein [Tenacibaculum sp. C7A-26P2]|uniref:VOC family protein n=1 Tax=Tenacibaculum sp. C7A-26P2 TaxID=3447504 RepID=UPI003F85D340
MKGKVQIRELKIYTKNLEGQFKFYSKIIGLKVIDYSENYTTFQIGNSRIQMVKSDISHPYHLAINIPCNREHEALKWLKERVEILKVGLNEIQDFRSWNAKAIYFYDLDNNIIEFIARKNIKNKSKTKFSADSLLEISEIGIPVNSIEKIFRKIHRTTGMKKFDGDFEKFCAIGDENGLFISINKKVKSWFPTGDKAYSATFEIRFIEKGYNYELKFINEDVTVTACGGY